jgi:hypothetical protein
MGWRIVAKAQEPRVTQLVGTCTFRDSNLREQVIQAVRIAAPPER